MLTINKKCYNLTKKQEKRKNQRNQRKRYFL